MKFIFTAFKAIDDIEKCRLFHEGHTKILTDLGIENLTSNDPAWFNDKNTLVILATDPSDEVIGGIRVQLFDGVYDLPIMTAIKDQDPQIIEAINKRHIKKGVAESCGLWNSKKVFGKGVSPLLARCSVALTAYFDIDNLVCFSAPYTLKMIKSLGFVEISEVGNNGQLPYPTERFISSVLEIPNIYTLEYADPIQRERILSLIENPNQVYLENSQGKEVEIEYNLISKNEFKEQI